MSVEYPEVVVLDTLGESVDMANDVQDKALPDQPVGQVSDVPATDANHQVSTPDGVPPIHDASVQKHTNNTGMWLFIVGFIFPFSWFIGSFFPKPVGKNEVKWRTINRFMAAIMMCLFVVAMVLIVLYYSEHQEPVAVRISQ